MKEAANNTRPINVCHLANQSLQLMRENAGLLGKGVNEMCAYFHEGKCRHCPFEALLVRYRSLTDLDSMH